MEQGSDVIFMNADAEDVVLLVVGDPFSATTHTDLVLRAKQQAIPTQVIHNASIMNAIGCCGLQVCTVLQLTISMAFDNNNFMVACFDVELMDSVYF